MPPNELKPTTIHSCTTTAPYGTFNHHPQTICRTFPYEKFVGISYMKIENLMVAGIISVNIKVLWQMIPFITTDR